MDLLGIIGLYAVGITGGLIVIGMVARIVWTILKVGWEAFD